MSGIDVIHIKMKEDEDIESFILRYETAEARLRATATPLPKLLLAINFILALNVDESQRHLIVNNINFEDNEEVYEDVKHSIRLHKGPPVENKINKTWKSFNGDNKY